jgi:hypothetical protein
MKKYLQVAVKQMVKANENSYLFQNLIKVDNSDIIYTDNWYLTKLKNGDSLPNGYYNRKGELTDITDDNYFERETFSTNGRYRYNKYYILYNIVFLFQPIISNYNILQL